MAKHYGEVIKAMRLERSMTQEGLEAASGVPQATIARVEATGAGQWSTFVSLARGLECSLDEIMGQIKATAKQ